MNEQNGLVVPQDREIPVQMGRHAGFAWRYAYHRASDTRKANDLGQDFLTFRYDDSSFIFALCDGVGQSFFGDLASRFLGNALMDWLWDDLPSTMDVEAVRSSLDTRLTSLTSEASNLVKSQPLPRNIPRMLDEVLEQKRGIGSESTFACGRIDLPSVAYPDGRVVLAWMGDSRIRMWDSNAERTGIFGDTFKTEQRWSTRIGPVKGKPNIYIAPLKRGDEYTANQFAAYSDGLALLDALARTPSTSDIDALIERAVQSATSDDISLLEVGVGINAVEPAVETNGQKVEQVAPAAPRVPAPRILSSVVLDRSVNVSWEGIQGIKQYQVELDNGRPSRWDAVSTVWASPPLDPSNYNMRVRAMSDIPGEWSQVIKVNIPLVPSSVPVSGSIPPSPPSPAPAMAAVSSASPVSAGAAATAASMPGASYAVPASASPPAPMPPPQVSPPARAQAAAPGAPAKASSGGFPIVIVVVVIVALLLIGGLAFVLLGGGGNKQGNGQISSGQPTRIGQSQSSPSVTQPVSIGLGNAASLTPTHSQPALALTLTPTPTPGLSGQTSVPTAAPVSDGPVNIVQTLRDSPASMSAVAFAPNAQVLAAASTDGKVRIYKGDNWQLALTRSAPNGAIQSLAFSPDGQVLAAGDTTGEVSLWQAPWEANEGKPLRFIPAHNQPVRSLAFSPDGKLLASASGEQSPRLWSIPSGVAVAAEGLQNPGAVNTVAFSPDGKTLAAGGADGKISLWQVQPLKLVDTVDTGSNPVGAMVYAPAGHLIAAADTTGKIGLFNTDTKAATTIEGLEGPATSLAFSPDGKLLAAGSPNTFIGLWDVATGKFLPWLEGHTGSVTSLAFAPGGNVLASGAVDKTVILWGTGSSTPISVALAGVAGQVPATPTPAPVPPKPQATPAPTKAGASSGSTGGGSARPTPTHTPSIAP